MLEAMTALAAKLAPQRLRLTSASATLLTVALMTGSASAVTLRSPWARTVESRISAMTTNGSGVAPSKVEPRTASTRLSAMRASVDMSWPTTLRAMTAPMTRSVDGVLRRAGPKAVVASMTASCVDAMTPTVCASTVLSTMRAVAPPRSELRASAPARATMTRCGAPEGEPVTAVRVIREVIWGAVMASIVRSTEARTVELLKDAVVERWKVLLARSPLRATRPTVGLTLGPPTRASRTDRSCAEMVAAVTVRSAPVTSAETAPDTSVDALMALALTTVSLMPPALITVSSSAATARVLVVTLASVNVAVALPSTIWWTTPTRSDTTPPSTSPVLVAEIVKGPDSTTAGPLAPPVGPVTEAEVSRVRWVVTTKRLASKPTTTTPTGRRLAALPSVTWRSTVVSSRAMTSTAEVATIRAPSLTEARVTLLPVTVSEPSGPVGTTSLPVTVSWVVAVVVDAVPA